MGVAKRKRAKERKQERKRRVREKKGQLLTDAVRTTWDPRRTLKKNFAALGLAYDANAAISQYQIDSTLEPEEYEIQADKSKIVDLLQVPEPPPKRQKTLGPREQYYCKRLYDKYGTDYKAMTRDRKDNYWQYTRKQLRKRMDLYLEFYKEDLEKKDKQKKEKKESTQ